MATPQLTHLIIFCGSLVTTIWLVAGEPLPAADKFPVPSAAAQNEALKLIEGIYADEHGKAQSPEEKTAFAEKLLQTTKETSWGTANHYALLRVAWDVATQGGDVKLAMQISDRIARLYDVNAFIARAATVKKTAESARSSSQNTALAMTALELVDEAVAGDTYDAATELTTIALAAARKARDGQLVKQIVARSKVVAEMAEAHVQVQTALSTLADDPTDPHANQAAGEYYCFVKGDWGKGIPMLALGSDVALRTLAVQDLKGTSSAKEQAELGDQWWQRSESSQDPQLADRLRSRAASWYRASVGRLAGLDKIRVQKRLNAIARPAGDTAKQEPTPSTPTTKERTTPKGEFVIVVWNTHNWGYTDRGTSTFDVSVFQGTREVWQKKDIDLEWNAKKATFTEIPVPVRAMDGVRVEITKCHGRSAGLAEIQVLRKRRNIARGCLVRTDGKAKQSPSNLTDGVTEDIGDGKGYWLHDKETGWVEVYLRMFARP